MDPEKSQPAPTEVGQTSERLVGETTTGAQAKLLFGEHISSATDSTDKAALEQKRDAAKPERTQKMKNSSLSEREKYWEDRAEVYKQEHNGEEMTKEKQMQEWEEDMDKFLAYYKENATPEEKRFFQSIGIDLGQADAIHVYKKFMKEHAGDVEYFAELVAKNNSEDEIEQNSTIIKAFGNTYGENSAKVAELLAQGFKNTETDTKAKAFVKSAHENLAKGDQMPGTDILTKLEENNKKWQEKHPAHPDTGTPEPARDTGTEPAAKPQEHEPALSPSEIADRLLDYETGQVKPDAQVDLEPSYRELVATALEKLKTHPELFPQDRPVYILSDVAVAMMERFAAEANRQNREFAFSLQGINIERGDENKIHVVAFASPASDFESPQVATVKADTAVQEARATELAQRTNLSEVFNKTGWGTRGDATAFLHVHHESLGTVFHGNPSSVDYGAGEKAVLQEEDQNIKISKWGVVTKTGENFYVNIVKSYRDTDGSIKHLEDLPILTETQLKQ